jgi:plastocyanin
MKSSLIALIVVVSNCLIWENAARAATFVVQMNSSLTFSPANLSIGVNDTVTWTNHSGGTHTSTSGASCTASGLWNSGSLSGANGSFSRTFSNAGSFPYFCSFSTHCSFGMVGSITVTNVPNQPPSVTITNPANNAVFNAPANVTVEATASDAEGSVTNVQFLVGTTVLTNDTAAPFNATTNNLPAGTYTLSVIASDNAGAKKTNQISIIVNALPSVSITNPVSGATFRAPTNLVLKATSSDSDGSITNVQFFLGDNSLGNVTASPFDFTVNNLGAGNYAFTAKAFDNRGATTTSGAINVSVLTSAILSSPAITNGQFRFTVQGVVNQTYTTEASSNLVNWIPLSTNVAPATFFDVFEPISNPDVQFFRVRQDF